MAEKRLVECQDCGYRWESGASDPRCAKSDCGRSRNVEPVEDDLDDEDDDTEADESEQQPVEPVEDDEPDPDPVEDDEDDSEGYTPAFEASTVRTDADRGDPGSSTSTDEQDEDDLDDEDDDGSSSTSTDEQDEPTGPDEVPELDPEQLKPAIDATFNMLAINRGQHWKLDDDEAEQLAEGWTPVMNHYAPILLKENALIVTAAITSYGVLAPRLAKDRELAEQDERDSVDDEADAGSVRQAVVEDTVEDEQPDEQTPSSNGAAPGGYASV